MSWAGELTPPSLGLSLSIPLAKQTDVPSFPTPWEAVVKSKAVGWLKWGEVGPHGSVQQHPCSKTLMFAPLGKLLERQLSNNVFYVSGF